MFLAEKSKVFLFWSSIALSRWLSVVMLSSGVGTTVIHVTRAILFRLLAFLEAFMDYCIVSMHGSYITLSLLDDMFYVRLLTLCKTRNFFPLMSFIWTLGVLFGEKGKMSEKNNFHHFLHELFSFVFHCLSLALAICLPLEYKMNGKPVVLYVQFMDSNMFYSLKVWLKVSLSGQISKWNSIL